MTLMRDVRNMVVKDGMQKTLENAAEVYRRHSEACICDMCAIHCAAEHIDTPRFSHDDVNNIREVLGLPQDVFENSREENRVIIILDDVLTEEQQVTARVRLSMYFKAGHPKIYFS